MKIDTIDKFNLEKKKHINNLENIRNFIFGDINNQPQVTFVPKMNEFDSLYIRMMEWLETSDFEDSTEGVQQNNTPIEVQERLNELQDSINFLQQLIQK